jgi:hypothetical protein
VHVDDVVGSSNYLRVEFILFLIAERNIFDGHKLVFGVYYPYPDEDLLLIFIPVLNL